MNKSEIILKFLSYLGLSFEESQVYMVLVQAGGMTILEISKATKVSRTTVYRIVERLKEQGLIEEVQNENKKIIKSIDAAKLEVLVKEAETKAEYLKKIFPEFLNIMPSGESLAQPGTRVMFYKGVEGIRQMIWNTLKAEGEIVGYSYRALSEIVGEEFASRWRIEFMLKNIKLRDIVGDEYLKSQKENGQHETYDEKYFETRFISENILSITHQIDIYNDVVAFYSWHEGSIFGVEVYNTKISRMQRQLFNIVWSATEHTK